ncbi:hypothetical protein SNE510_73040 [Streptomyces sp. NE5-10]|nr:hypothetical protein SNE510_73040 [Streptomyces sp. NE5-10]
MPEQPAAKHEDLGLRVVEQRGGDRRTVGDHGARQALREHVDDGRRRGTSVEDHDAARPYE